MRIYIIAFLVVGLTGCTRESPEKTKKSYGSVLEDPSKFVEITNDPYVLDIRYATMNNFVDTIMYPCARCFLRPEVALRLDSARMDLEARGLGIKLFDCYRPLDVQWKFWKKVPDERYVAHPVKGSMHNRGLAVDLTLIDADGRELDMGTGYDHFGEEAYHDYKDLPDSVLTNRTLLLQTMTRYGFEHYPTEWWHYSYVDKKKRWKVEKRVWQCN